MPEWVGTLISNLGQTNLATLIIVVLSTAFLFWVRKGLKPLLIKTGLQSRPADLIAKAGPIAALATATLAVVLLALEERGVAIVGDIPPSLPPFTMPLFAAGLWQARKTVGSGTSGSVRVDLGG